MWKERKAKREDDFHKKQENRLDGKLFSLSNDSGQWLYEGLEWLFIYHTERVWEHSVPRGNSQFNRITRQIMSRKFLFPNAIIEN